MIATSSAEIGGFPILGEGAVEWTMVAGVVPASSTFALIPQDADALLGGPLREIKLVLRDGDRDVAIRRLYAIHRVPGPNKKIARVLVVDRRFWWTYGRIARFYNIRRRIGFKRLNNPQSVLELNNIADDVGYAPWSLDGKFRWEARAMLADVLEAVVSHEPGEMGRDSFDIDPKLTRGGVDALPIENLELDARADQAIARALAYLPEAGITVDAKGIVQVYSKIDGSEEKIVERAGYESVGGGHIELIDMHRIRPREIHVLFSREIEVRFDAAEHDLGETFTPPGEDDRFMKNVLPVPDYELTLASGETVSQGTWIPITTALAAWNAIGWPVIGNLNIATIRRASVPYIDLWAALALTGDIDADANWIARLSAIQNHFRRTYQVNRRWVDRYFSLHAYRVGLIDVETGSRAQPTVYTDYAIVPSQRMLVSKANGKNTLAYVVNMKGYPDQDAETGQYPITAETTASPFTVDVLDSDQGIIRIDSTPHLSRAYEEVLPSMVELEGANTPAGQKPSIPGPSGDLTDRQRPIAFNMVGPGMGRPQLTGNHRMSVILTAFPGAPNSDQRFERIVVKPADIADGLPSTAQAGIGESHGPILEIRVGAGRETARVAWKDDKSTEIEKAFGVIAGAPDLTEITINADTQEKIATHGGASLHDIARAVATAWYASFTDRFAGVGTFPFVEGARPSGRMDTMRYTLGTDGRAETILELPNSFPQLEADSLLDASTRAILYRLVNPGRGRG